MFFRRKKSGKNEYLQIVENRWESGGSKQSVVATLGRMDELKASGQLDRLLASGAKFAESIMVIDAHAKGELPSVGTRRIGPVLVFERLWEESGLKSVIDKLLQGRKFEFPVERAIFLSVLKRLFGGGSDRFCEKWAADYGIELVEGFGPSSPLSGDGLARRGVARSRASGPHLLTAVYQGSDRGRVVLSHP